MSQPSHERPHAHSNGLFRVFRWAAVLAVVVFVGLAGGVLWQQRNDVDAPLEKGICWRMNPIGASPQFDVIGRDVSGLEACAANLERIHKHTGATLTGAYQGRFIFVDNEAIRSSNTLNGVHWRLYFDAQRTALDKKLDIRPLEMTTQPAPKP